MRVSCRFRASGALWLLSFHEAWGSRRGPSGRAGGLERGFLSGCSWEKVGSSCPRRLCHGLSLPSFPQGPPPSHSPHLGDTAPTGKTGQLCPGTGPPAPADADALDVETVTLTADLKSWPLGGWAGGTRFLEHTEQGHRPPLQTSRGFPTNREPDARTMGPMAFSFAGRHMKSRGGMPKTGEGSPVGPGVWHTPPAPESRAHRHERAASGRSRMGVGVGP